MSLFGDSAQTAAAVNAGGSGKLATQGRFFLD
jgi:hypothetical protein